MNVWIVLGFLMMGYGMVALAIYFIKTPADERTVTGFLLSGYTSLFVGFIVFLIAACADSYRPYNPDSARKKMMDYEVRELEKSKEKQKNKSDYSDDTLWEIMNKMADE